MSRFSVVVPAYRVQGYLRECLDSVLTQSHTDWQLTVVDDASPDASGAIAEEYAERDPRVQAVRLPERAGVGAARNTGARHATGDYLLFLDADDTLLPGALAAIDAALTEGGDPEVLVYGHDRTDWWDKVWGGDDFEAGDPLALTPAAWNRAVRRDFWTERALVFAPEGPYEDVVPAHRTVLEATALATLPRPCVRWRKRRAGSIGGTPGPQHLAVVERYGELLAATPAAARLFPVAVGRILAVLDDGSRTAPADRPELFRLAAELHRAHRPVGHTPEGPREQALAAGSWSAYEKAEKARSRKKSVRSALARRKKKIRSRVMKAAYRTDLRTARLDPDLAVYGAYWNRGVSCNPAAIHARAREIAPHVNGVFVVSSRHRDRVPDGVPYVIEGSRRYWQTMATATYLINNSSFPGGFTKRPGQVYLQTHHGTPLKKMGLDQRRYPAGTHGISFAKVLAHTDQWDYSLSSNPHSTQVWERVYPSAAYTPLEAGYPRNDVYFTTGDDEIRRIRRELGIADGQRAVLYAPTHRDYQKGFLPRLDLARFADALGDDHVVLVRAHYFYGTRAGLADAHPRLLDVTGHDRVEDLCLAADALVTDYSSLMFDYACLDRPIVTYAPDWQAYRLARGTYFDLLSGLPGDTPGAVAVTEEELLAHFRDGTWDTAATTRLRSAFRERFCGYDDGHAADRVVQALFLNG
ncbi:bifunctional glycosyltransferase/CDP-glycerol:glycerophosphate glycerophosphotransferase [Streptomyces longispororuber]|uniref:bifunctional glycosyltransferase/CDP-glycerol:glycerophosphate glycerophosphotransferase n=1 Tax=Streptomyces longispororuber TaxID=68230 RepID=UPI00210AA564|nr:bifunctional glycosyltransferase family 2 protein/CDP-glycerol:glycerophosphate glycerophosphotransferase [Streptomyces longispororuber]MCQ4213043.1 bifunctional glycosyltransferase family 2 protein/CDP-glycerol:glycerophosphate glycerophosphotransferase [Streptomyces longispororuber]